VVRERRAFIGYPAWREGVEPRQGQLREAVVDFYVPDADWRALRPKLENPKMSSQTRNFAMNVKVGDIMLVPRPSRGVVFAGRVIRPFEVLDDPPWGDEYLRLREAQGLDTSNMFSHLADIAQCCEVAEFRPLPFTTVPAWVRRSLLGRSTFGRLHTLPVLDLNAYTSLSALLDRPWRAARPWTSDPVEVERRLADFIGPGTFEHLCVALLQLEHPDEVWEHVGGSGDGGVDGVAALATDPSRMVGVLQCKWAYWGGPIAIAKPRSGANPRQILASLLHPDNLAPVDGVELWTRQRVAALVLKHAATLPIATTSKRQRPLDGSPTKTAIVPCMNERQHRQERRCSR
jgi:hypothetical protein